MTVWVLGEQFSHESHSFARRHASHPHNFTLLFSVMRHFRDELRERGREMATRGEL